MRTWLLGIVTVLSLTACSGGGESSDDEPPGHDMAEEYCDNLADDMPSEYLTDRETCIAEMREEAGG